MIKEFHGVAFAIIETAKTVTVSSSLVSRKWAELGGNDVSAFQ